jgi:hypothetical protein
MDERSEERWPILRDIGLSIGLGLLAAFHYGFSGGFVASWVACTAGVFFLVTVHHTIGDLSWIQAVVAMAVAGAIGGAVWWFVADTTLAPWQASAAGAGLVVIFTAIQLGVEKLQGRVV